MPIKAPQSSKDLLPFALGEAAGNPPRATAAASTSATPSKELLALRTGCEKFARLCEQTNRAGTAVLINSFAEVFQALANPTLDNRKIFQQCEAELENAIATLNKSLSAKSGA